MLTVKQIANTRAATLQRTSDSTPQLEPGSPIRRWKKKVNRCEDNCDERSALGMGVA